MILILFLTTWEMSSQSLDADSLLLYEKKIYATAQADQQEAILNKLNYFWRSGFTGIEALKDIKRVQAEKISREEEKKRFYWNAAVTSYLNKEADLARHYILRYRSVSWSDTTASLFLALLIEQYQDTLLAGQYRQRLVSIDPSFSGLTCFSDAALYSRRHKNAYMLASALLPGSGTALNGAILKGIGSLLLVSASAYGVYTLVEYGLYLNAVMWGSGVGLKFYTGNILLSEKEFYRKEEREKAKLSKHCELCLQDLLDKYPLNLKR
ncbi:MAG TPA: hypothetical protein PLQ93_05495 [Bacteroidia bacterium]|nr:hypothetical protein [Bacteroidia bacterium]